ncbi:Uncharacterised protein [Salmonella enterica]|nr:Uncharacterised protein [Salmonella enterica]
MVRRIVGIPCRMPDNLRGYECKSGEYCLLTVFYRLAQRTGRGMDISAQIANVVNHPA